MPFLNLPDDVDRLRARALANRLLVVLMTVGLATFVIWQAWNHLGDEHDRLVRIRALTQEAVELQIELAELHLPPPNLEEVATRLETMGQQYPSMQALDLPPIRPLLRRAEWLSTLAGRLEGASVETKSDRDIAAIRSEYSEVQNALSSDLQSFVRSLRKLEEHLLSSSAQLGAWMFTGSIAVLTVLLVLLILEKDRNQESRSVSSLEQASSLRSRLHSQKMEAVGRLAGGIAHDLNNYLAAITAHCELVRMGAAPENDLTSKMNRVISTSDKAAALLRQLLNFSRQKPAMTAVVNLNSVVNDLDPMLRRLLGEDVALELELDGELHNVEIDPSQMEQVVVNLAVNAREALPAGGRIRISTWNAVGRIEENLRTRDLVVLSVADNGPGIPDEIRDRIFEPYFSTKSGASSSGLGLATVYGIANQHNGDVKLGRGLGQGARFDIRLPKTEKPAISRNSTRGPVRGASGQERILLVEDNEELRLATAEMLQGLGYDTRSAADGEQALEAFDEEPGGFDVVISDVIMSGMGGPALAAAVRERDPEQPVLLVSGYRDSTIFGREEIADVEFLPKPFTAKALDKRIRELLDSEEPRD